MVNSIIVNLLKILAGKKEKRSYERDKITYALEYGCDAVEYCREKWE